MKELPELYVYYPSLNIKAYDSRTFGYFKYVGICVIPNIYVLLDQLITEEDYHAQIHSLKFMERFQEAKRQTTVVCKHHVIV
jgi:hypothetical protein